MKTEIKSEQDVNEFAKEANAEVTALKAANVEKDTKLADVDAQLKSMAEKFKTIQVQLKDALSIERDDSEEAKLYKLGSFVKALYRKDGGEANRLGGIPTINSETEGFKVRPGFEARYKALHDRFWLKAALSSDPMTSDDSDDSDFFGSYLVPVDILPEVMRIAEEASAMMSLVTSRPVRGITTTVPTTTDALTFTRLTDQETAATEDTWTWTKATLTVYDYATWIAITEDMDQDSLIALGAFIRAMVGEAWGTKFDTLALSDSTTGAMAASGINQVTMGAGDVAFSSLTTDYLDQMITELTTRGKRRGARFFMSPSVWDYPANEVDDNGNYKIRRFSDAEPLQVRGYPVTLTDGMPDISDSAVSTDFVAFGNPTYILNGNRLGLEFRIYDQTESSMKYSQIYLRARVRQAFTLAIPSAWSKLTTAAV